MAREMSGGGVGEKEVLRERSGSSLVFECKECGLSYPDALQLQTHKTKFCRARARVLLPDRQAVTSEHVSEFCASGSDGVLSAGSM